MDEHDLSGKTFVVTGANAGIGRATAEALARRGGRVVLSGRSLERTQPVLDAIRSENADADVSFVKMDLLSLASVREAALEILEREPRIDVLVDNAGVAGHRGVTEDGFEIQFGVNHVGHFLFTRLLLPRLLESAPARVVVVASRNHRSAKEGIDYDAVRGMTRTRVGLHEYDVSKLANVLFAKELARRYGKDGVTACSLNPGRVASDVWRRIPWPIRPIWKLVGNMKTNEEGAQTTLFCATAPLAELENGGYYEDEKRAEESPLAKDPALARELWEKSDAWVAAFL
jgi:NAD(P)-dependent dehydrogenase (short-subunit alcohol dehydrogenase family)